jgi:hypothetical protein
VIMETSKSRAAEAFFRSFCLNPGTASTSASPTGAVTVTSVEPLLELLDVSQLKASEAIFMTADEWRVRGIDFALSAVGAEQIESFLSRAITCFERAKDEVLLKRAELHLALERHRWSIIQKTAEKREALSAVEMNKLPYTLVESLKCGLRDQVTHLCAMLPSLIDYDDYDDTFLRYFKSESLLKNLCEFAQVREMFAPASVASLAAPAAAVGACKVAGCLSFSAY